EDVPIGIRGGHVSNRRVSNGEDEGGGDTKIPVPAGAAADPETESPCAVPVEGPGVCLQRLSCKRRIDGDIPQHNASGVEFEELEVSRPSLCPSNGIRWAISQIYCDSNVLVLGTACDHCYRAKWRGATAARAVVRLQIVNYRGRRRGSAHDTCRQRQDECPLAHNHCSTP